MSIIIKLQGLPLQATSVDVRRYFLGLTIPDGGVHIVGGDEGTVFIEFASDEDARQAMARGDGTIKDSNIKLLLSSRTEMQTVTEAARQKQQQYLQQQQLHQQEQHNQLQQQQQQQQQLRHPQQQTNIQSQPIHQNLNQQQPYLPSVVSPMGPALLPTSQHQQLPFDNDPRMLSQNYQGIMSSIATQPHSPKNQLQQPQQQIQQQQQHQQLQPQQQQPPPPQQQQPQQPQPFIDPRILSQNYQGMISALNQNQPQPQQLLPQPQPLLPQAGQIFNPFSPTTIATTMASNNLGINLLGNVGLGGTDMNLNSVVVTSSGGTVVGNVALEAQGNLGNNGNISNRNHSPDTRARMSGMRGGDDKLFANKRCVLAASNIPYRATSKDIIEFLSEFNIKEDCIRRRYNQKGQPTADAKIAFPTPDAALKALKMMNKKTLCGRPVFLKPV